MRCFTKKTFPYRRIAVFFITSSSTFLHSFRIFIRSSLGKPGVSNKGTGFSSVMVFRYSSGLIRNRLLSLMYSNSSVPGYGMRLLKLTLATGYFLASRMQSSISSLLSYGVPTRKNNFTSSPTSHASLTARSIVSMVSPFFNFDKASN